MSRGTGATIVTGGTGGLGAGVVRALIDAGHDVVVTWIVEKEIEHFPAELRDRCRLERVDVLSGDELGKLIDRCRPDGIWALVHLVGGYLDGAPIADMDMGDWDLQLQLNLRSAALALRAVLPSMVERGQGRAVAVSSRAARMPFAGAAAYAASKAGVIALVEAASAEVKNAGVCVNCVLPSVIDTPGNRAAQPDADPSRWVRPEEIGAVIAFLCSSEASGVTGASIPVYGRV
jgi:NAD(P)-dependent dehydrogenase (short-subunit alcohol dehydrogenase family)